MLRCVILCVQLIKSIIRLWAELTLTSAANKSHLHRFHIQIQTRSSAGLPSTQTWTQVMELCLIYDLCRYSFICLKIQIYASVNLWADIHILEAVIYRLWKQNMSMLLFYLFIYLHQCEISFNYFQPYFQYLQCNFKKRALLILNDF